MGIRNLESGIRPRGSVTLNQHVRAPFVEFLTVTQKTVLQTSKLAFKIRSYQELEPRTYNKKQQAHFRHTSAHHSRNAIARFRAHPQQKSSYKLVRDQDNQSQVQSTAPLSPNPRMTTLRNNNGSHAKQFRKLNWCDTRWSTKRSPCGNR